MPRVLWLLVIGMMVNVTGSSFLWPLNTIYIHDKLGKSLSVAGLVLMLNAAATVVGNLSGGVLYDKIGGYRSILLGTIMTVLALAGLNIWHGWPHYVFFLAIIGLGTGMIMPSMYAMAGSVWKEGGRRAFNAVYIAQNVGVAVGSALGGFVASLSFEYIFMANLWMFVAFLFIAVFGYRHISNQSIPQASSVNQPAPKRNKHKLIALLILCTAFLLCWVGYVQWMSTIASYTQDINISLKQYGLLWTINGALIVLGQPIVSPVIKKSSLHLKGQIIVGMIIFILSFIIAGAADGFKGLAAAMIILTFGEMFVWPAVPTIANQLAPKGREGFYQGIVNSTGTGGRMIGPLLGGMLVDFYGMSMLFIVLIALLVIAILLTIVYDRSLKATSNKKISTSI